MTRYPFLTAAWIFGVAAFIGGLFEFGTTWVAAWGLACAVAVIGWSLTAWLEDRRDDQPAEWSPFNAEGFLDEDKLAAMGFLNVGAMIEDDELPYRRPEPAPVWMREWRSVE